MLIALRCDGGNAVGAGHVGRCLPVATALARSGHVPVMVGDHDGVALELIERAGVERRPPADAPCGIPNDVDAALIDVYGLPADERRAAADRRPVVILRDAEGPAPPPPGALLLDYHLDAGENRLPDAPGALCGPDYAPLDPRVVAAQDGPHDGPTLVALGGSTVGTVVLEPLLDALLEHGHERILVAGALVPGPRAGIDHIGPLAGLHDVLGQVSAVCCGASVTAYEAAAAGTAALLVVLVDNQARVGRAFGALTPVLDVRDGIDPDAARAAVDGLGRSTLPVAGPAFVDGYGAARVCDALLALAAGDPVAAPLRQRPAVAADAALLLAWRNDPAVRALSTTTEAIDPAEHAGWLRGVLADPDRTLLVVEREAAPVATVRFDRDLAGREAEISVTVDPAARSAGTGRRVLREATERELASRPGLERVVARIHADNGPSLRAFEAAGYAPGPADGTWRRLEAVR